MTQDDLRAILRDSNVQAFLRVIRERESSQIDQGPNSAYTIINGGAHFDGFADHPTPGRSTHDGGRAAGAFQFIPSTWREVCEQYGFTDFSPASQEMGAVARLIYRDALDDVLAGRFESAVAKCRKEWTSLPGAAESSGSWTMAKAFAVAQKYGWTQASNAPPPQPAKGETAVDPLTLSLVGTALSTFIPQIGKLFGGGEIAQRNTAAAQLVVDTVVSATNSVNAQQAIEKMQASPAVAQAAKEAVLAEPAIMAILEVGGGIVAARANDQQTMLNEKPFWKTSAVFWISMVLLPMVYWYVGSSVVGGIAIPESWPWYAQLPLKFFGTAWSLDARSGMGNLVIGLVLGGICGVYFGISVTQQRQQNPTSKG